MPLTPDGFQTRLHMHLDPWLGTSEPIGFAAGYATYYGSPGSCYHFYLGQIEDQFTGNAGPPANNTLWEIDSCTKTVTAALLALQACAQRVQPSDPVLDYLRSYFSNPPPSLQNITLEDLASMSAGLEGSACPNPPPPFAPFEGGQTSDVFAYLANADNYGTPGSFNYSNLSYALLSYALVVCVLEVSPPDGQLIGDLLAICRTNLFDLLGMTSPVFYPPTSNGSSFTFPYGITGSRRNPAKEKGGDSQWPALAGAGALVMTAPDFLTWLRANMGALGSASPLGTSQLLFLRSSPLSTTCPGCSKPWVEGQSITRGWFQASYTGRFSQKERRIYAKYGSVSTGFRCGLAYGDPSTSPGQPSGSPAHHGVFVLGNCNLKGFRLVPILEDLMDYVIEEGPPAPGAPA
jgi:hypothetical protein